MAAVEVGVFEAAWAAHRRAIYKRIEYDVGPGTIAIGQSPNWPPSKDGPSAALEVENFEAAVDVLRQNKIEFLIGPMETPVCHMVAFRDPDGNRLSLHRRKKR